MIFTPADNLKVGTLIPHYIENLLQNELQKTGDMAVGQVSFHNDKRVREDFAF